MELLMSLVFKCYKNDFAIEIKPHINGLVEVKHWHEKEPEEEFRDYTDVSEGYTQNWEHENPEEVLTRMHQEVDDYIESLYMEEDVSFDEDETEDRSRLTSYERKMKEAGHKEGDFL